MGTIWRPCHEIKGERSMAMPRNLLFFDTETRMTTLPDGATEHRLRLGWACHWRRSYGRHVDREDVVFLYRRQTLLAMAILAYRRID